MAKPKKLLKARPAQRPEDVIAAVQQAMENVRTKSVDFSFNELLDMYKNDELKIDPAYQRLFRWDEQKQSQFIESLILELPIPPIYVVEEEEGRYELIDGLQRFSSYLHLRGVLRALDGRIHDALTMDGCDIVPELKGITYTTLPTALQIRLKRMAVTVQIVRKESDRRLRYHMFKRLNTGGEPLSHQEVRNATIRLLGVRFNEFIQRLAAVESFQRCTEIMTAEAKQRMSKEECVLRFFAFKNDFDSYTKLITPFLDEFMERMSDESVQSSADFDYAREERIFRSTFDMFDRTTGAQSFSTVVLKGGKATLGNQFSQLHFDALTLGIQSHLEALSERATADSEAVRNALIAIKTDQAFVEGTTGGGKNYRSAYQRNIAHVTTRVSEWLATASQIS